MRNSTFLSKCMAWGTDIINKFSNSTTVKKFSQKYPHSYKFITDRFSLRTFTGLPLTILLASFTINFLLLNKITEHFMNSPFMLSIDNSVAEFFFSNRNALIAQSLFYLSKLGTLPLITAISFIVIVAFLIRKKFIQIVSLLVALFGSAFTIEYGKNYFHRIRPQEFSFYEEPSYSFPSGHATIAVAFYGLIFYVIIRNSLYIQRKFQWTLLALVFMFLLGFSRLYLGVHYLSDVIAGYSLGVLWLLLAISIIEWKIYKPD